MNRESILKAKIMNRVFSFWFLRSMVPLLIIEFLVLTAAAYFFANLIFIGAVVDNALSAALGNPFKFAAYLLDAFFGTRTEVKIVILLFVLVVLKLLRDINRGIIAYALTKRSG